MLTETARAFTRNAVVQLQYGDANASYPNGAMLAAFGTEFYVWVADHADQDAALEALVALATA